MIASPADTIGLILLIVWMASIFAVVLFAASQQFGAYLKASAIAILSLLGTWLCLGI